MSDENDFFDYWLFYQDDSSSGAAQRPSEMFAGGDSLQFNETIKGWFAASLEAGKPPAHLRDVLAHECWQPTAFPGSNVVLRAIQRTGWFVPEAEKSKPVAKKKKRGVQMPHFREDEIACFVCAEAASAEALPAATCLKQLAPSTRVVLVSDGDKWFGFFSAQLKALREYQQKQGAERTSARSETRRLELLAGQGSVEEFLDMTVKVKKQVELDYGHAQYGPARARVLSVYTAGYRGGSEAETQTMREWLTSIAERSDYDGIECNPPRFSDKPAASFGPNFARRMLQGEDARNTTACPARRVREFKMGEWYTRFGSRADAMMKKEVSALIPTVQTMLAAIPPGQDALPRAAVQSVEGALYLRCEPRYGQRQWLERFLCRCQKALRARWRVGIF
jgi:hypothetical protein